MPKSFSFNARYLPGMVTPETADEEFSVSHDLGRLPLEAFVLGRTGATGTTIYRGPTTWTATTIYLRSSVGQAQFGLLLF